MNIHDILEELGNAGPRETGNGKILRLYSLLGGLPHITGILEIGTFKGRTTRFFSIVAGQFGVDVHTIEYNKSNASFAKNALSDRKNVIVHEGDALEVLPELLPKIDINVAFIDGRHSFGHSYNEYLLCKESMEEGIIIFDDASKVHPEGSSDGGVPKAISQVVGIVCENDMAWVMV